MRRLDRSLLPEPPRSVLAIVPIFGTDMARPQLVEPIARHLRGLLGDDARGYLVDELGDE